MTTRAEIAVALTGTGLVDGSEFRPTILGSRAAWGQVTGHSYPTGAVQITNWGVYVVLPQEEQAAAAWYDANYRTLIDALHLNTGLWVDSDAPIRLDGGDAGTLFALLFTARE